MAPGDFEDYLGDWAQLQRLVTDGVEERLDLDFKGEAYKASDSDKRELRRDVTALANAGGGHLMLGVESDKGQGEVAVRVPGVPDPDTEEVRTREVLSKCIAPPLDVTAFRVRQIRGPSPVGVVVVTVGKAAPGRPYGVAEGDRPVEFWVRRDKSKRQMTYSEIMEKFSINPTAEVTVQTLGEIVAKLNALLAKVASAEDPNVGALREAFEGTDRGARIFIQPIVPDDFRDDVFHLLEVQPTHIVLEKASNDQRLTLGFNDIQSFVPLGLSRDKRLILKPPGKLAWDDAAKRWFYRSDDHYIAHGPAHRHDDRADGQLLPRLQPGRSRCQSRGNMNPWKRAFQGSWPIRKAGYAEPPSLHLH